MKNKIWISNRKQIECLNGFYFDFWPAAGAWAADSAGFFDFITIATIRCSSIRKARTILNQTQQKCTYIEWVQNTKRKCSSADCYNARKET